MGTTDDGVILLRSEDVPLMSIEAPIGMFRLVDDQVPVVVRPDGSPSGIYGHGYEQTVEDTPVHDAIITVGGLLDADAAILVMAISPRFAATFSHEGGYRMDPAGDHVLEESHLYGNSLGMRYPQADYRYTSGNGLGLELAPSATSLAVEGDFAVYFWGMSVHGAAGEPKRTGFWSDPVLGPVPGSVSRDHYAHAVLTVQGGRLEIGVRDAPVELYSRGFTLQALGAVAYQETSGSLATEDDTMLARGGTVNAEGGVYQMSPGEDGRMLVRVDQPPADVRGDSVTIMPAPPLSPSARAALALGTLVLLALAVLYASPAVLGTRRLRGFGTRGRLGWRNRRAEGYAGLAARAEGRENPRRAALWSGLAARAQPGNPDRFLMQAVHLREAGRLKAALRAHDRAHFWFQAGDDQGQLAHNAYEAARAASRAGRGESALDWLRIAVEADPWLGSQVGREPDFAPLRGLPDYGSLRGTLNGWVSA